MEEVGRWIDIAAGKPYSHSQAYAGLIELSMCAGRVVRSGTNEKELNPVSMQLLK
jgi:hypothetical protein